MASTIAPWISTLSSSTPILRRIRTKLAHPRLVIPPAPSNPPKPPVLPDPPPPYIYLILVSNLLLPLEILGLAHLRSLIPRVSPYLFPSPMILTTTGEHSRRSTGTSPDLNGTRSGSSPVRARFFTTPFLVFSSSSSHLRPAAYRHRKLAVADSLPTVKETVQSQPIFLSHMGLVRLWLMMGLEWFSLLMGQAHEFNLNSLAELAIFHHRTLLSIPTTIHLDKPSAPAPSLAPTKSNILHFYLNELNAMCYGFTPAS